MFLKTARHGLTVGWLAAFPLPGTRAAQPPAQPVATVIGEPSVLLNNVEIETPGVVSWTVLSGDQVETRAESALVQLLGNAVAIVLAPGTSIQLDGVSATIRKGQAVVRCGLGCNFHVLARNRSIGLRPGDKIRIEITAREIAVRPVADFPALNFPPGWLTRRATYVWGKHLSDSP